MKNSGFQMHGIFPATREQERLQKVVEEIHFRRKNGGRPEIRDVNKFTSQLLALANTYRTLRQEHETAEIARKRFSEIGKLAEKLSSAMDGLSDLERKLLCDMQGRAFHDCSGLDENALADREDLLRSGYKLRDSWHASEDFVWLTAGAKLLCKSRPRSRPQNSIEKRIAQEFVVLCHRHGWSPIGVSRTGTEHKNSSSPRPSDSILCFAAVLEAGGCRYAPKAATALESLRDGFEYMTGPTWVEHGVTVYDSEECDIYIVNLREKPRRLTGMEHLPNFVPELRKAGDGESQQEG